MRKVLGVMFGVMLVAGLASAQTIVGSSHDFSGSDWADGEICKPCHTPHNAYPGTDNTLAPLWNHAPTTSTFTLYSSPTGTLNATMGQPATASLACLSCHDGSVALDAFGGATGTVGNVITGSANFGTDLSNDHPVSFTYDSALATADGELYDPATTAAVSNLLFSGQLECASCHDVHNTPGFPRMLIMDNTGSALCLTCHNK